MRRGPADSCTVGVCASLLGGLSPVGSWLAHLHCRSLPGASAAKQRNSMINFVVNSTQFHNHLKMVARNLVSKPPIAVMGMVRMEVLQGMLTMTATDSECWSRYTLQLEGSDIFDGSGSFCIQPTIQHLFRELPEQPVQVLVENGLYASFSYHNEGRVNVPVGCTEDFPEVPSVNGGTFSLDASSLMCAIDRTLFATNPSDVLRPVFGGICLDVAGRSMTLVGSNGAMLSVCTCETDASRPARLILPHRAALLVCAMLDMALRRHRCDDRPPTVSVSYDDRRVSFATDGNTVCSIQVKGTYPNYRAVMPTDSPYLLSVDRAGLVDAIRRIRQSSPNAVIVTLTDGAMQLRSSLSPLMASNCCERLPCQWSGPDGFVVGFSCLLLSDLLSHLYSDQVLVYLSDSRSPARFEGSAEDDSGATMVLTPIVVD